MFGIQSLSNLFSSSQGAVAYPIPACVLQEPRSWQQDRIKGEVVDFEWNEASHKSGNLNLSLVSHFQDITVAAVAGRLEAFFVGKSIFYKFGQPCKNPSYRVGDSIEETFHMSLVSFNRIFEKIGVIYNSKEAYDEASQVGDPFAGKLYLRYYDRMSHISFYLRNDPVADNAFPNTRKIPVQNKLAFSSGTQNTAFQEKSRSLSENPTTPLKNSGSSTKCTNSISRNSKKQFRKNNTSLDNNPLLGGRVRAPEDKKEALTIGEGVLPSVTTTNDRADEKTERLASRKNTEAHSTSRHANEVRREEKKTSSQRELSPLVQEMLSIWKNVVGHAIHQGSNDTLSSEMPQKMEDVLGTHFQGDLNEWLKFCREKIVTSIWLMGENPTQTWYGRGAYLSWAVNNIERILNNEFDTKRVIPKTEAELQIETHQRQLIDQRQSLLNRKDGLTAEIQKSREDTLKKEIAEISEEDKGNLFPEFVETQAKKGHQIKAPDSQAPWEGLSFLDRLLWESTLADFLRPRLFSEDIDVVVQQTLLEERIEERLSGITSALEALSIHQEGQMVTYEKRDATSSSANPSQQRAPSETTPPQDTQAPLDSQPSSTDLLPEEGFESEEEEWDEWRNPLEDEPFERQSMSDEEWTAQEYGTQPASRGCVMEKAYSHDNSTQESGA